MVFRRADERNRLCSEYVLWRGVDPSERGLVTVCQPSLHWAGRDRWIEMQQVDFVGSLGLVLLIAALTVLGYRINQVVWNSGVFVHQLENICGGFLLDFYFEKLFWKKLKIEKSKKKRSRLVAIALLNEYTHKHANEIVFEIFIKCLHAQTHTGTELFFTYHSFFAPYWIVKFTYYTEHTKQNI